MAQGVGVEADEVLPVGKAEREQVCGPRCEGGLPNAGHAIHGVDHHHRTQPRRPGQAFEFVFATGEPGDVPRQRPRHRHRRRCGLYHLLGMLDGHMGHDVLCAPVTELHTLGTS